MRNLRRKFEYLASSESETYRKVMAWPYIEGQKRFEENYKEIKECFEKKENAKNSLNYVEDLYKIKSKGGRSESMQNDFMKEPLGVDLQEHLSPILYKKHLFQLKKAFHYDQEILREDNDQIIFLIWHIIGDPEERLAKGHNLTGIKELTFTNVIVRFLKLKGLFAVMLFIARIKNPKRISESIHPRWIRKETAALNIFSSEEKKNISDLEKLAREEERKKERS